MRTSCQFLKDPKKNPRSSQRELGVEKKFEIYTINTMMKSSIIIDTLVKPTLKKEPSTLAKQCEQTNKYIEVILFMLMSQFDDPRCKACL